MFFLRSANAQTTTQDLQNQINQKNSDIQALEQEIAQFQSELNTIGKQKSTLASSIAELDLNRKKLVADIAVTQNKIDKTNFEIQGLSSQIGTKEDSIQKAQEAIILDIKQTDEFEKRSLVETIISDNDFATAWTDIDNMATIQGSIRKLIQSLHQVKGELESTRTATIKAKGDLTNLKSQLSDEKKIVEQNTTEKNKLLAQTKNTEIGYQKLLADRQAKKDAFEKDLRDYESQLKYILDPKSLPPAGVLSWPLANIFVTQRFGKTESGKRLYVNGTHNGVDFGASIGTPVMAMANGVVAGTGDTDAQCPGVSFGRFVLIKYDDGLASTFGHLSLIKVKRGDSILRGEIAGYSGNTGYSTGPHLHVSVYARDAVDVQTLPAKTCIGKVLTQPISPVNAYLDPLFYLPSTTPDMFKKDV